MPVGCRLTNQNPPRQSLGFLSIFTTPQYGQILAMEKKYDEKFKLVFKAIYQLMEEEEKPKHQIGFTTKDDK